MKPPFATPSPVCRKSAWPDPPAAPTAASQNSSIGCRKFSISTAAKIAIVCVLLLRGPQTPGELRGRTDRMYHFEALEDVVSTLDRLAQRQPPLARILPRQPGTKESRYTHLFSGEPPEQEMPQDNVARAASPAAGANSTAERLATLESEVAHLREELAEVHHQLAAFRKQFE
jgi:hypothetical protein